MHVAFGRVRRKTSPTAIEVLFGLGDPTPTKLSMYF